MMLGLGDAVVSGSVGTRTIQPFGPVVPLDHTAQPYNCPAGSDFADSQRMGMCVDSESNPVYSQSSATGKTMYYALDGSAWEVDPLVAGDKARDTSWIPGIPNTLVLGALGLLLVMKMAR